VKRLFLSFFLLAVVCAAAAQALSAPRESATDPKFSVTDWRDYDSIYTERYAGLVPQFEEGYKKGSPITYAADLKGHLLEVHGTSDDNVHMQNTMQMLNAFITAGKQVDLQLYPRKTHSISGSGTRVHLFTRIRSHFHRVLLGTE
jgi:dipeptidyl-peptidase-4